MVPQPRSYTQSPIVEKAASTGVDVRYGGATTTVTRLEAGQGSGNINKTLTMPHDSPLPRVNTLRSDEGSMTLQELMVFCTTLSKKVETLGDRLEGDQANYMVLLYTRAYPKTVKKLEKENKIQGRYVQDMEFNLNVSTAELISTAGASVTTASVAAVSTASPTRRGFN
ncbi:hypothetical protein Tco_0598741 [Tanacetum coccineum]